ncbi:MAG: sulfatase-like hydrolase/transferase [Rikenellaceae bacterium]
MTNLNYTIAAALIATCGVCEAKQKQPNVILVMCDDLGWGDVGFNGNTIIQTPHIDNMASNGVIFNRFYTACAVSSPTRASVLTGRNPYRMGVFNANVGILRPEEITIPELLKEEGYATGHFGKWHLGTLTASERDANRGKVGNERELNLPRDHGYDAAFVTESKVPTWDPMITPVNNKSKNGWNAIAEGEASKPYGTHYWDIDGNKVSDNLEGDDSRVIMDRVLPFIKQSSDANTPFLSVVWFHTPHKPCVAGAEYAKMYSEYSEDFMNYAGCITAMDDQMGRLLAFLEENDLADDTIIFFCSDNGPENGEGVTGGFRERKRSLYEGGVRVPSFVYWGKNIKKPLRTDYPTVTCDYLPTIASLVGVDPAKCEYELDGIDITRVIQGKEKGERNTPIVLAYNGQVAYYGDTYKLYTKWDKHEFYNIVEDPYEKNPLTVCPDGDAKSQCMYSIFERYRLSFEGEEYGQASFNKLQQSWPNK